MKRGDWGLRSGSLINPLLCLTVNDSSRSKTCKVFCFDLTNNTFEIIETLSQDKFWINSIDTPINSPKNLAIESAKKIYNEKYNGSDKIIFPINSTGTSSNAADMNQTSKTSSSTAVASAGAISNAKIQKLSTKTLKKTANTNAISAQDATSQVVGIDQNNVSVAEQIRLGSEAADRIREQTNLIASSATSKGKTTIKPKKNAKNNSLSVEYESQVGLNENNVSVADQIRLGMEAAKIIQDQTNSINQQRTTLSSTSSNTNIGSSTNGSGPKLKSVLMKARQLREAEEAIASSANSSSSSSSSSSTTTNGGTILGTTMTVPRRWSTESRTYGSTVTQDSLIGFGYGQGLSRTFETALGSANVNSNSIRAQSQSVRDQSQGMLLSEINRFNQNRSSTTSSYANSASSTSIYANNPISSASASGVKNNMLSSSNSMQSSYTSNTTDDYQDTMEGDGTNGLGNTREELELDTKTCISTMSNNSKPNNSLYPARILNPNGENNKAYCLKLEDLAINDTQRLKLANDTPRFAGHNSRRPPKMGICYVYVVDKDGVIKLYEIDGHLEIITQLVMVEGSEIGIMGDKGDYSYWNGVKSKLTDRNVVSEFKDIISPVLAHTIVNSTYTKEWKTKWTHQIGSIFTSLKSHFNPGSDGK